jgi:hypothetical protein
VLLELYETYVREHVAQAAAAAATDTETPDPTPTKESA